MTISGLTIANPVAGAAAKRAILRGRRSGMRHALIRPVASVERQALAGLALALLPAACHRDAAPAPLETRYTFPAADVVDMLFVVDDSTSTDECSLSIGQNFPALYGRLEKRAGGLPDLHIGVISQDIGAGRFDIAGCHPGGLRGALLDRPPWTTKDSCFPAPGDRFISVTPAGESNTGSKQPADVFSCLTDYCCGGCGLESPLGAALKALDGSAPENAGFLRQGSLLALWSCTDEDDCAQPPDGELADPNDTDLASKWGPLNSFRCFEFGVLCDGLKPARAATTKPYSNCVSNEMGPLVPVGDMVAFFDALRPRQTFLAGLLVPIESPASVGLAGNGFPELSPVCTAVHGAAAPAPRIHDFARRLGDRVSRYGICTGNYWPYLDDYGARIDRALARCVTEPAAACSVSATSPTGETPIPACTEDAAGPCFEFAADPLCGAAQSLRVRWGALDPTGKNLDVRCLVAPPA